MKRNQLLIYFGLIGLGLSALFCSPLDQIAEPRSQRSTVEARSTGTAVAQATAFWPTATALASTADSQLAPVDDPADDGQDCTTAEPLASGLPDTSDISRVTLAVDATVALFTIELQPEVDLHRQLQARGARFDASVAVANPGFPLPPDNPDIAIDTYQNETYSVRWERNLQRLLPIRGLFGNVQRTDTADVEGFSVAVDGNRLVLSIRTDLLPAEGSWWVATGGDKNQCDFAGLSVSGAEWQALPLEVPSG